MSFKFRWSILPSLAAAGLGLLLVQAHASAEELRNPRLQKALQMLEVARAQLDAAMQQDPPELRDGARDAATRVDAAAHAITDSLSALRTPRQVEPGRAGPTNHPIHDARDSLTRALDEFTRGVRPDDFKGRERVALDQMRAALDVAERLTRREDAMPPPAPVVEVRFPRIQRSVQNLEAAREYLDMIQRSGPPELRADAHQAGLDTDAALNEAMESLVAAGTTRTVEQGHAQATNQPAHAARDVLQRAADEMAAAAAPEFRGHDRRALERIRIALEETTRLERHER